MEDKNLFNMADDGEEKENDGSNKEQNLDTQNKKDHNIQEIISILTDENSDINTIGMENLSDKPIDVTSALKDIDEDTSVGRSIINIDRDEIKETKKWENSFYKSASDTIDELMKKKEEAPGGQDSFVKIKSVEKVAPVGKLNLKDDSKEKSKEKSKDAKKQSKTKPKLKISEMFSELFTKHKKLLVVFLLSIFIFLAFGIAFYAIVINKPVQTIKMYELDDYTNEHATIERKRSGTYKVLNEGLFDGGEIYFLKDVENRQQLSLIIKSKNGKVLVFDGGWGEDAPRLTSLIKELGGTVNYWFITHGDPDHVGALYEIAADDDLMGIKIERIVYSFFKKEIYSVLGVEEPWFYEALITRFMDLSEKKNIAILNDLSLDQVIKIDDVSVRIISDTRHLYRVDNYFDNNSSCCYKIIMNDKSITVLGDIAKDASDYILRLNAADTLKSDIVVMSHHGQDGAKMDLYEAISPEICLWGTPDWLYENKNGTWDTFTTIKWMKDLQIEKHCISKDGDWIIR